MEISLNKPRNIPNYVCDLGPFSKIWSHIAIHSNTIAICNMAFSYPYCSVPNVYTYSYEDGHIRRFISTYVVHTVYVTCVFILSYV